MTLAEEQFANGCALGPTTIIMDYKQGYYIGLNSFFHGNIQGYSCIFDKFLSKTSKPSLKFLASTLMKGVEMQESVGIAGSIFICKT